MANKGDPLGYDLSVGPQPDGGVDMYPDGRTASGVTLAINEVVARSMTGLIRMTGAPGGVREFGVNTRTWVGSPVTDSTNTRRGQELAMVYARSPRLDRGSITVKVAAAPSGKSYALTSSVNFRTITGVSVAMVLGISALTVDILAAQQGVS